MPLPLWTEKTMAPHSSTLAWKIPWTEEPGGLQSMRRVGHDWSDLAAAAAFTEGTWVTSGTWVAYIIGSSTQSTGRKTGHLTLQSQGASDLYPHVFIQTGSVTPVWGVLPHLVTLMLHNRYCISKAMHGNCQKKKKNIVKAKMLAARWLLNNQNFTAYYKSQGS